MCGYEEIPVEEDGFLKYRQLPKKLPKTAPGTDAGGRRMSSDSLRVSQTAVRDRPELPFE